MAAGPSERASYTFFDLAQQPLDLPQEPLSEVDLISDEDSQGGLPVCPICLGEIFDLRDKAVVISCMHVFCLACISRWSSLKKSCPLCKSRIQGYMYNILSVTDYQERILPATPPRAKTPPSPVQQRQRGVALIDARPSGGVRRDAGRGQLPGGQPLLPDRPGDRTSVFRRGREQIEEFVPGIWPPVRAARSMDASTSSRHAPLKEPRPYFYRVQAQAQSQVLGGPLAGRGGSRAVDGASSQQDAVEAWRRHVYVQGMRAVPMEEAAVAGQPGMSEDRRAARLSAWVDRELRSLLQTDDVAIVRAYVMGLVRGIGFARSGDGTEPPARQPQGAVGSGRGGEQTDAVAALRPFLQEHAEHFWHELRCFAAVPLSMQTYDRLVRYKDPRQAAASSPTPVPSTDSSSTAALLEPLPRSRAGSAVAGAPRPTVEDPQPSSGHRGNRGGSPELSRKRRRFSSRPPEEAGSDGAVGGRESDSRHPRDQVPFRQKLDRAYDPSARNCSSSVTRA
ncbi:hypothetical protein COCSUDRAFT_40298 [Coccomyxa subellipsoidea C-169]|uniref:RING-type E3 ubiquitin transferase n=1 Tax=Coccomyxa subellipsoidea (strain C-169) TaxID=574566 RepID=I0Z686_COCSC|nr:hypothetical protein COCSUDRAFT_40298 [Coccomyxa subellipsoidea C-169]EIE26155.1 hypothetical protein COCSUDRAFT_40298 [Coccomyxa subellipsoidea C-169]|eukprot:XP_005650699.1 hypothetical protein COCSUDRAFT_40298 [Coccomyxa subellipsoidea C-169]